MNLQAYPAPTYTQDRGNFGALRHSNVLIYFPHGLGDYVQFSYVSRFLNPTNKYWITRYGDDNTSIMGGHPTITPLYLGINDTQCGDGAGFSNQHFGLRFDEIDGGIRDVLMPGSLYLDCVRNEITHVLWHRFPEIWGSAEFPFHTKARRIIPEIATQDSLRDVDLSRPLQSALNFTVSPEVQSWVEARLMNFTGWTGSKLCVISRNGFTAIGKNWGHMFREDLPPWQRYEGYECREFMRLMLKKDPRWTFLVLEDRFFEGENTVRDPELHSFSYAEIFGAADNERFPFGWIIKAVLNCTELSIGVPTGPYHLSMAKPDLPTIGLWIEHLPSWYDEPKDNSIHLISRHVQDLNLESRAGSFFKKGNLTFNAVRLETRIIPAEQVVNAAETLLS